MAALENKSLDLKGLSVKQKKTADSKHEEESISMKTDEEVPIVSGETGNIEEDYLDRK